MTAADWNSQNRQKGESVSRKDNRCREMQAESGRNFKCFDTKAEGYWQLTDI